MDSKIMLIIMGALIYALILIRIYSAAVETSLSIVKNIFNDVTGKIKILHRKPIPIPFLEIKGSSNVHVRMSLHTMLSFYFAVTLANLTMYSGMYFAAWLCDASTSIIYMLLAWLILLPVALLYIPKENPYFVAIYKYFIAKYNNKAKEAGIHLVIIL